MRHKQDRRYLAVAFGAVFKSAVLGFIKNGAENGSGSTRLKPLKRLNRLIRYG